MKYLALLAAIAHVSAMIVSGTPLVTNSINGVSYRGISANGVEQFQSIFFGQPTSGERRFAPPQPYVPPENTTIIATASGAACPQLWAGNVFSSAVTNISEDCLSLRIARPANTSATDKLPIMVWFSGGGHTIGQIYDPFFDPTGLVLEATANKKPIIYVAINFRVNLFGYASSEALRKMESLNAGLKDQRLGLQWVKDNIVAFGGDPDNVTIFGQSDGATDVGLQLTAYGGKRDALFHRAIMQSGSPTTDAGLNGNISSTSYAAVAAMTNCTRGDPGSNETLACLRELSMETLLNITFTYAEIRNPPFGFDIYFPVIDDNFIPATPSELVKSGQFSKNISVITGWTADDGSLFTPASIANDSGVATFLTSTYPGLTESTVARILALYPVSDFEFQVLPNDTVNAHYYRASRMFRDSKFTCPSIYFSYHVMKYSKADAWLYELNQSAFTAYYASTGTSYFGVSHVSDIPYVFNEVSLFNGTASDSLLAAQISGNWSAFATTGMLSKKTWPVGYSQVDFTAPKKAVVNVIGGPYAGPARINTDNCEGPVGMEKLLLRCGFWNGIYDQLRV